MENKGEQINELADLISSTHYKWMGEAQYSPARLAEILIESGYTRTNQSVNTNEEIPGNPGKNKQLSLLDSI